MTIILQCELFPKTTTFRLNFQAYELICKLDKAWIMGHDISSLLVPIHFIIQFNQPGSK